MTERTRRTGAQAAALLAVAVFGLLMTASARTEEVQASDDGESGASQPGSSQPFVAKSPAGKPLDLLLTRAELRAVVRDYEARTGENLTAPIDEDDAEVIVKARGVLAPMRDVSQEPWGGIAAPFWAIMNPTQAWRILLPIPPKGDRKEEGPIRAEDRP
jgi:hypothetical protein